MSEVDVHHIINRAYAVIQDVQNIMSFHHAESELSRLNSNAYQKIVTVHPWLYQVLCRAQKYINIPMDYLTVPWHLS